MTGLKNETPRAEVLSTTKEVDSEHIVYLTLGDGDFTYSLDLARYLKLSSVSSSSPTKQKRPKLILTGVDTLEELTSKYKDSPSILQDIRNQQNEVSSISVTIRHGVNAIVHPNEIDDANGPVHEPADHVLFHHPHLGTENCSLHKRFLAHLFHSVNNYWMKPNGGIFHLTLVEGQYDRWKCQEQAERHGLELIHKSPFAPPPLANYDGTKSADKNNGNRYHYRRHQTGKSFATRRPNGKSFTYTFGRTIDKGMFAATTLPWQNQCPSPADTNIATGKSVEKETIASSAVKPSMLSCPFCDKEFLEKRSLKCHLRDKHSSAVATAEEEVNAEENPRKKKKLEMCLTENKRSESLSFSCLHCKPQRVFQSEKALQSHIRAKHSGIYTYIAPDWSSSKIKEIQNSGIEQPDDDSKRENHSNKVEECRICGYKLVNGSFALHLDDFLPVERLKTFACDFCSKVFREERAKLQHTNFCSKRPI